jgi:hypothetical protein
VLIGSFGSSYLQEWSKEYVLLREAIVCKHTEVPNYFKDLVPEFMTET